MDKKTQIRGANQFVKNSMAGYLGIEIIDIEDDFLVATMPVNEKTIQPMGILHGGASVVLAESLGSIGSSMIVDPDKYYAVGQTINASHIRPGVKGWVSGTAKPIHIGTRSHIWDIQLYNDQQKLMCSCRLTMAIVKK